MFEWHLDRPLAVFDIEATGTSTRSDRIVELAIVRLMPDKTRSTHTFRVNPRMPIPPEATAIHGISDEDVAGSPVFSDVAGEISGLLDKCDLAGYNIIHFDIPLLTEEFIRAKREFTIEGRRIIDAQRIFHIREPRDLTSALAFFCGETHHEAHQAESDAIATIKVLEGQFERYPDLPRAMDELHAYCNQRKPDWLDRMGRLKWTDGKIVLNFGKKKGVPLRDLIKNEPGFIKWMLKGDFPRDTQEIVRNAMADKWPEPPRDG